MFKTYKDSLPEGEDPLGEPTFDDIVKLLKMCGKSKSGLYTYYIKFRHGNTVFDAMLDRILEMELNDSSSTNIICTSKTLKKWWKIHCEFLRWNMENITSYNQIMIYYKVARLRWGVSANTVTKKFPALSV